MMGTSGCGFPQPLNFVQAAGPGLRGVPADLLYTCPSDGYGCPDESHFISPIGASGET
jgi:hypothetical protein